LNDCSGHTDHDDFDALVGQPNQDLVKLRVFGCHVLLGLPIEEKTASDGVGRQVFVPADGGSELDRRRCCRRREPAELPETLIGHEPTPSY
jgi:hypothetical protein